MLQVVETHAQIGDENAHTGKRGAARIALGAACQRTVGARPDAVAERAQDASLPFGCRLETSQAHACRPRFGENMRSLGLDTRERILARIERARLLLERSDLPKLALQLLHEIIEAVDLANEQVLLDVLSLGDAANHAQRLVESGVAQTEDHRL